MLSGFAAAILNCVADTIYSSEVIPTAYAVDFAVQKDHNMYRGIIDVDNYSAKLSGVFGISASDIFVTDADREAMSVELGEIVATIASDKNIPVERAAINMRMFTRFYYLIKLYEKSMKNVRMIYLPKH